MRGFFANLQHKVTLRASLDDSGKATEMHDFLKEVAELSDKISLVADGDFSYRPSFEIVGINKGQIRFAAIPMGHEFSSFVLAVLQAGGTPVKWEQDVIDAVSSISQQYDFTSYISLSCQNCPDVVQALNAMAVLNPNISSLSVDGALFQQEVDGLNIMSVPTVYLNGADFFNGRATVTEILSKLGLVDESKVVETLDKKQIFDVLIIGGGPAGVAAAIYAARKGIRTGVVADAIGGQVLETLAIENFVSVKHTEGPRLALDFLEHMKDYDIDIMENNRVANIESIAEGYRVNLVNGASLKTKTLIVSTGARWRKMSVPGEEQYLKKGIAFCPHCDGPLFKNKDVAVIGGGNSGVEAAIDLAGITSHVTLIEFADSLKADEVLQKKLASLDNVKVIKSAQVVEVFGNGTSVTAVDYLDRTTQEKHNLPLDGIFVQIGLMPNSEWISDVVAVNRMGEIIIDEKCQTSKPGIFAAGDVSSVPYKQIVISIGEGAKASLSAFDYLIRH